MANRPTSRAPTRRSDWPAPTPTRRACASSRDPTGSVAGWKQLNVEVYGGILNNSWLDRDLGVAGRLTHADGYARAGERRPTDRPGATARGPPRSRRQRGRSRSTRSNTSDRCGASARRPPGEFAAVDRRRGRLRRPGVLGAVPVRRAAGGRARRRRVAARQRAARQPAVVLGGGRRLDRRPARPRRSR